ncbi:YcjF family protein [Polyangium mundeleinium]|uniref:DUF697 domain-containing protein n=1 Tax=Polyangium mundeleinium TaxID=2995306 RepID=A0ABT5F496_9BACT|nr:DUF697 domain-containing protein [Polyangium mundeleinium]MDC0747896.1 DUF697 domain-containing protein [Polyangium mundeleinium]
MAGEATKADRTKTFTKDDSRAGRAEAIIRRNVLWALVAGVLPVPVADFVAIKGVQLKMLRELADLYEVKFTHEVVTMLVGSLISSTWSVGVGATLGYGLVKLVPVVGTALGLISTPLVAGAATYALGKVFTMHFETGGTFLDFDPNAMRSHFRSEFEKAKETVATMQQEP